MAGASNAKAGLLETQASDCGPRPAGGVPGLEGWEEIGMRLHGRFVEIIIGTPLREWACERLDPPVFGVRFVLAFPSVVLWVWERGYWEQVARPAANTKGMT